MLIRVDLTGVSSQARSPAPLRTASLAPRRGLSRILRRPVGRGYLQPSARGAPGRELESLNRRDRRSPPPPPIRAPHNRRLQPDGPDNPSCAWSTPPHLGHPVRAASPGFP